MNEGEVIALAITTFTLLIGLPSVIFRHLRQMAEIKLKTEQQNMGSQKVLSEIQELKTQMAALRDTTTRYDMSFDTALQRLESRVANLESPSPAHSSDSQPPQITVGR
jgi:aspartate carbamoyltransferase catalytic subunit